MMKKRITLCLSMIALWMLACSAPAGTAATPIPPSLSVNTGTVPVGETAALPTESLNALATLLPHGQPDPNWNGFPIMPGAIAGEGDAESYRFTIRASRDDIQGFYERELAKLGWTAMAAGEGNAGAFLMFFTDAQEASLTVTIIPNGDEFLVMLVK